MRRLYNVALIQAVLQRGGPNATKLGKALGKKPKDNLQAQKPAGGRRSQPKSFLTRPGGDKTFGSTDTKRKTLLGVS